jgi:hypothetical protein
MCETTKCDVAAGANGHGQQNVLVFHIADFNRHQLEFGVQATRQLTQRVRDHIKRSAGGAATVSIRRSGTIVALVDGDRSVAEELAGAIVSHFETTPLSLNGHGEIAEVELACGIIAFPQAGPPVVESIPLPALAAEAATAVAG